MRLGRSQKNHRKLHRWTSVKEGPGSGRRGHVLWGAGPSIMGFMLMEPHHLDMSCMFWLGVCTMSGEDHIPELVFPYLHSGKKCHFPTWRSYWKASFIVVQVWQSIVISYATSNLSHLHLLGFGCLLSILPFPLSGIFVMLIFNWHMIIIHIYGYKIAFLYLYTMDSNQFRVISISAMTYRYIIFVCVGHSPSPLY